MASFAVSSKPIPIPRKNKSKSFLTTAKQEEERLFNEMILNQRLNRPREPAILFSNQKFIQNKPNTVPEVVPEVVPKSDYAALLKEITEKYKSLPSSRSTSQPSLRRTRKKKSPQKSKKKSPQKSKKKSPQKSKKKSPQKSKKKSSSPLETRPWSGIHKSNIRNMKTKRKSY